MFSSCNKQEQNTNCSYRFSFGVLSLGKKSNVVNSSSDSKVSEQMRTIKPRSLGVALSEQLSYGRRGIGRQEVANDVSPCEFLRDNDAVIDLHTPPRVPRQM